MLSVNESRDQEVVALPDVQEEKFRKLRRSDLVEPMLDAYLCQISGPMTALGGICRGRTYLQQQR